MTATAPSNPPFTSNAQPWPSNPSPQQQQQPAMAEHRQLQQAPQTPRTRPQNAPPVGSVQPLTPSTRLPPKPPSPPSPSAGPSVASPSGKRDLKSWWKSFLLQNKSQEPTREQAKPRIFGVPLRQSIAYANVAISLVDENGESYVFGYVPIVVAKCGVFLKEKATHVEGIFRLSGSEKRIKQLKTAFNTPDRYGKGLNWDGYTVHDASNVLRRYLNDLPEPVVPLAFYERFREPLRRALVPGVSDSDGPQLVEGFDYNGAILKYQNLVMELPPLNRQLLLYLLDLLSVFASASDKNRMTSQNLSAIFQPGILSHPAHAMAPEEYRLNQAVLVFLIENQDYFIEIGRRAAHADHHAQKDTPPVTPGLLTGSSMRRSASNASAGANSVVREGMIRRNHSTSSHPSLRSLHSRHSRHSNANSMSNNHVGHSPSPYSGSPAPGTPTKASPSGSLSRSNTLPARSPGLGSGRFPKRPEGLPASPLTPLHAHRSPSAQGTPSFSPVAEALSPVDDVEALEPLVPPQEEVTHGAGTSPATPRVPPQAEVTHGAGTGPATPERPAESAADKLSTNTPPRRFNIFLRPLANDSNGEPRPQPNKLKKKRMPGSANASAQSSTLSFRSASAQDVPSADLHIKPEAPLATPPADHHIRPEAPFPVDHHVKPDAPLADTPTAVGTMPQSGMNGLSAVGSDDDGKSTPHVSQAPSTETTATATPTPVASITVITGADTAVKAATDPAKDTAQVTTASTAAAGTSTDTTATTAAEMAEETAPTTTFSDIVRPTAKPKKSSTSLASSFEEHGLDEVDEVQEPEAAPAAEAPVEEQPDKEKKRRWRLSRRRDDSQSISVPAQGPGPRQSTSNVSAISTPPGPGSSVGSNGLAGHSTSSIGSGGPTLAGMGPMSLAGASVSTDSAIAGNYDAHDYKDEAGRKKLSGWLKSKVRGTKDGVDERRALSPSPTGQRPSYEAQAAQAAQALQNGSAATSAGEKGTQPMV